MFASTDIRWQTPPKSTSPHKISSKLILNELSVELPRSPCKSQKTTRTSPLADKKRKKNNNKNKLSLKLNENNSLNKEEPPKTCPALVNSRVYFPNGKVQNSGMQNLVSPPVQNIPSNFQVTMFDRNDCQQQQQQQPLTHNSTSKPSSETKYIITMVSKNLKTNTLLTRAFKIPLSDKLINLDDKNLTYHKFEFDLSKRRDLRVGDFVVVDERIRKREKGDENCCAKFNFGQIFGLVDFSYFSSGIMKCLEKSSESVLYYRIIFLHKKV